MRGTMAALQFIVRGMSDLPGRKSVIIMSDNLPIQQQEINFAGGEEVWEDDFTALERRRNPTANPINTEKVSDTSYYWAGLQKVAEVAIRGSVVIYAVDTRGLQITGLTAGDDVRGSWRTTQTMANTVADARTRMLEINRQGAEMIARQTGGFLVYNSNDFGLRRVLEDQKGYYVIGFRPFEETFNRNFHRISAKLKRGGLTVRTRAGFYGFTEDEARAGNPMVTDPLMKALLSPFAANELAVKLTTFFVDQKSGPVLRSFVFLDPSQLTFKQDADGSRVASFDLRGMLFGDNGKVVADKNQTAGFRMRPEQYDQARREGILYAFDIPATVSGPLQFRVAVRDTTSSHVGAAGQFVEIPDLGNGRLAVSGIVVRDEATLGSEAGNTGPAVRRFPLGANLIFIYAIYNAPGNAPKLTAQTRIFREGKEILSGSPMVLDLQDQPDLKRITSAARIQLGKQLDIGEYLMQIIVTDSSQQKPRMASQWIDFEVIR
jgi:hypothetical protein